MKHVVLAAWMAGTIIAGWVDVWLLVASITSWLTAALYVWLGLKHLVNRRNQ